MPIITTPRHMQEGPTPNGLPNYYPQPQKPGIAPPPDAGLGFEAIPDTQNCLHCGREFFFTGRRPVCLKCRMEGKS